MFTHHLSTIAPVKSSFLRHFHAGDHSQDRKSLPCATAGQGKTTASNGLDCDFSRACYFFFTSPFHLMPPQNNMTPGSTNENLIILVFSFFFLPLFSASLRAVKRLCRAHWHSPPCPSLMLLLIALVWGKGLSRSLIHLTPLHHALTSDLW